MNKEQTLILELCTFLNPNREKIDALLKESINWPYVLGEILFHRAGSIAYHSLKATQLWANVPREVRSALKNTYESDVNKAKSMELAVKMLSDILSKGTFPYAFLKGSILTGSYPQGLRTSNDIDLLVRQKDLTEIESLLKENGFEQGYLKTDEFKPATRAEILSARMNRGETVPFVKCVDLPQMKYLEVDLNFSLDFKAKYESDTVGMFLSHVVDYLMPNGVSLRTLDKYDFFIHLCVHLHKEATTYAWVERQSDIGLYKFADLYLLYNQWLSNNNEYTNLSNRIREYGLERECYYALFYMTEIFKIRDRFFEDFLCQIQPQNMDFLREITSPTDNQVYRYDKPFSEWIFTNNRKELLYEASNETP